MKKIERYRVPSMRGHAGAFDTTAVGDGTGLRASVMDDGQVMAQVTDKDRGGRRKIASTTLSLDSALRLHHALGEALKGLGLYAELQTQEEVEAEQARRSEAANRGMARYIGSVRRMRAGSEWNSED